MDLIYKSIHNSKNVEAQCFPSKEFFIYRQSRREGEGKKRWEGVGEQYTPVNIVPEAYRRCLMGLDGYNKVPEPTQSYTDAEIRELQTYSLCYNQR